MFLLLKPWLNRHGFDRYRGEIPICQEPGCDRQFPGLFNGVSPGYSSLTQYRPDHFAFCTALSNCFGNERIQINGPLINGEFLQSNQFILIPCPTFSYWIVENTLKFSFAFFAGKWSIKPRTERVINNCYGFCW